MLKVDDGQCGKCAHFGGDEAGERVIQIRIKGEAPADAIEECGHPELTTAGLRVAPISSCDRFTPYAHSA
ncbi:MAG: hypothetical protein AAGB48_02055 [Planctomycetota bacterium]